MGRCIDKLLAWCDKNGHASFGEMVMRGCIASLWAGAGMGVIAGIVVGFVWVR